MKIAIIGGGLFGVSSAIKIKENFINSNVDLFEKNSDLLMGASGKNQFRWHRGYHYPRSENTIRECLDNYQEFSKYFKKSEIVSDNYYAIAKNNTKTNFDDYLEVLKKNSLDFKIVNNENIKKHMVEGIVKVKENLVNIDILRKLSKKYLKELNVNICLNNFIELTLEFKKRYDYIIVATYENNNKILKLKTKNKYQLVEKIIVKTPKNFKKKSFVILDGNFMCIDPYKNSNSSILGHVSKSIHKTLINNEPNFDRKFTTLINNYHNEQKNFSKFQFIKNDFKKYFNGMDNLEFKSSFYVVRCTKKNKEKTDERLSECSLIGNIISIFSGKWVSSFSASKKILDIIS